MRTAPLLTVVAAVSLSVVTGCGSASHVVTRPVLLNADPAPATAPAAGTDDAKARASFETVSKVLGRPGVYRTPGVYVVTVPRDDLAILIEGMEVPTAAGIESAFYFYYCPCGKTVVAGQVCVLDYEQNDVIDALRAGKIEVASVAPMLLHVREQPIAVRFQAEGKPEVIAGALKEALRWTGKERMPAVEPIPLPPP